MMPQPANLESGRLQTLLSVSLRLVLPGAATGLFLIVLRYCTYGYEFSDEGYYLNWISHPFNFSPEISRFGYIYHILYVAVSGHIALLRQINLTITFCLGVVACLCVFRCLAGNAAGQRRMSPDAIALSITGASPVLLTSVLYGANWLPTPSYNSLTLQALLLSSIALCLVADQVRALRIAGLVLVGLAGFVAFMAKPTSALALGVLITPALLLAADIRWTSLLLSVAVAILAVLIQAVLIDGSISGFLLHLRWALERTTVLNAGYSAAGLIRIDFFTLSLAEWLRLALITIFVVLASFGICSKDSRTNVISKLAVLIIGVVALLVALGIIEPLFKIRLFQGVQFLALVFAALAHRYLRGGASSTLSRRSMIFAIFFFLLPFVYGFGSGLNYWWKSAEASVFWMLSALAIYLSHKSRTEDRRALYAPVVVALFLAATFIQHGVMHPYRQGMPLFADRSRFEFASDNQLLLSKDLTEYLNGLRELADAHGFQHRAPMIDLTGHYPGALFAIGARPLGFAWISGGYRGSQDVAVQALDRVACADLANAWLLLEPEWPGQISTNVLQRRGIRVDQDFEVVGHLDAPVGVFHRSYQQQLLKPKSDRILSECRDPSGT